MELLDFTVHSDDRGRLAVLNELPFAATRLFTLHCDHGYQWRGAHAHRTDSQCIVPVSGVMMLKVDDGKAIQQFMLQAYHAAYLPPLHWVEYCWTTGGGRAVVLTAMPYDKADYIYDRDEFYRLVGKR